jgi:hypothetical protein
VSRVDLSTTSTQLDKAANDTIVALLAVQVYWRDLIRDILPEGSNGIMVVVESPCSEKFTYQVFGSQVKYLGVGVHYELKYRHSEKSSDFADFSTLSLHKDEYSGLPLDKKLLSVHLTSLPVRHYGF